MVFSPGSGLSIFVEVSCGWGSSMSMGSVKSFCWYDCVRVKRIL